MSKSSLGLLEDILMSSISGLGSSQYTYNSPLQQLEAELQNEVSAGTVSSSDESALSTALTSIDSSLNAGQSSSASQASGSAGGSGDSGPGDIKSKINSLIQAQVSSGALTSDQATELQNLFANTFGNGPGGQGGPGGPGGPGGGPGGPGGPPPGPPPSGGSSSSDSAASALTQLLDSSTSTDGSSDSSSTDGSSSLSNLLQDFLKQLQDAQSFAYGANGTTTASSTSASTLINYQA
jgi:hypothetical protein